ncbi:trypsin-like peptidase domain-containing protein [Patescibacteria group bacterium]|nr:trypsin-like peptidase domain-containing protein [Patescibacteria group bacterium]
MTSSDLTKKIKEVKNSIVAVGIKISDDKVKIIGSGFCVAEQGKILSAAHLFVKVPPEQLQSLVSLAVTQDKEKGLEYYNWLPLKLLKKDDQQDVALLQLERSDETLMKPLELGDSDKVEAGQDTYFIGYPYAALLVNEGFGVTRLVNKGIVSSVKRNKDDPAQIDWIIIDGISNPGNSGCPLIDIESNKVIGIIAISFRTKSKTHTDLDIREPMHICAAKPVNLAKELLK